MELHEALSNLMDAGVVTDHADEYGEPGYVGGPVVFGDWWCRCPDEPDAGTPYGDGTPRLHDIDHKYPEEFAAMAAAGCELHWLDEWYVSQESSPSKAWRTTSDSYSWQSSLLWSESAGEYLTPDDGLEAWVEELVNNPRSCLTGLHWSNDDLEALGFKERECGFANGWYDGQDDDPEAITAAIRAQDGDAVDVLFKLSGVGQFHVHFCVFVRGADDDPLSELDEVD